MPVSLTKGGSVSLTKLAPELSAVTVALGWVIDESATAQVDLDASALVCGADGRVLSDAYFVFFNNLSSPGGAVEHVGDRLSGALATAGGGEDKEQIKVDLSALPANVDRVVFPVSIYDADRRHQTFSHVAGAFIRVLDRSDGRELARYELSDETALETAMILGELYRSGGEWKFRAIGHGYRTGLAGVVQDYGVDVG